MSIQLWFDVGIKRYTTAVRHRWMISKLWFDVGIKRYTTFLPKDYGLSQLWFDVGIKRYTTLRNKLLNKQSCGLM